MDSIHDMGGMHGFGPIQEEENEPLFHHDWEAKVLGMTLAAGSHGRWNIDMGRWYRERTPPALYLNYSYYEIWLDALERLLIDTGLMTREELISGKAGENTITEPDTLRVLKADTVEKVLRSGGPARRKKGSNHRFEVGELVVVRNFHPETHTRAPRYVRGRVGMIDRDHGFQVFPDSNALKQGEKPQRCYSVRFSLQELWGEDASADDFVYADLWDSYLDPEGWAP